MPRQTAILFISGSLRQGSAHHAILEHLKVTHPEHQITIFEGIEEIPNFNPAKDVEPFPKAVVKFREAVSSANGILICTPEYAYALPGAFKNALDWAVSSGDFVDKPVALITASGLGEYAHTSLQLVMKAMNAKILDGAILHIPWFKTKMDIENNITDAQTERNIQNVFDALIKSINAY